MIVLTITYTLSIMHAITHSRASMYPLQNNSGLQYKSAEWNKLLSGTFAKYTDQTHVSVNAIRSAFVTHAKEHVKNNGILESIAGAMRHSVRYQQQVYDKRTHNEKMKKGMTFATYELFKNQEEEEDDDDQAGPSSSSPARKRTRVDGEDVDASSVSVVAPGEVVAVTCDDGPTKFRLAKVVRAEHQTVLLSGMKVVSEGLYRPVLGTKARWNEAIPNVVTGIDVSFDEDKRAYRLHTTEEEILDNL